MLVLMLRVALVVIVVEGLFSVPYRSLELAWGTGSVSVLVAVSALIAVVLVAMVRVLAATWSQALRRLAASVTKIPAGLWLGGLMTFAALTRVAWVALFPAPLRSDGQTYFQIAQHLVQAGVYQDPRGDLAFWPPGYPFFLFALMKVLGTGAWVAFAGNLLLFAITLFGVYRLAHYLLGPGPARLATLVLAVWPNLVFTSGTASKELFIAALLPLVLYGYVRAADDGRGWLRWAHLGATGVTLALAALAQPAIMLFPSVLAGYEWVRASTIRTAASRWLVATLVMAGIVGLWTFRNYQVLGAFVPVSTNGGSTFYRANNPLATGGYVAVGERSLDGMSEVDQNRQGTAWAVEWIRTHPLPFGRLAIYKQILFLGDDGVGAYETLKRALNIGDRRYIAAKLVSNLFWIGLLAAILAALFAPPVGSERALAVLALTVGYFWVIDSIFESGGRHHVPMAGALAILAAMGGRPRG